MTLLKIIRYLKIFDENVGFYESMKRQFEFLNKDFESLKEKCFLLSEINKIICEKKLQNPPKILPSNITIEQFEKDYISENEGNNFDRKNEQRNFEAETPLLNSLMKQKRRKEYREKTLLIQSGIKKT